MESTAHLWLFFIMVLGIVALPGMDMAFIVANAVSGGRRAGLVALAGVMAGAVIHVAAGGLGIGLLLQVFPYLFNAMLLAGAAYIAWIGYSLIRHAEADSALPQARASGTGWRTFAQAVTTALLNPKAYLFMLAVFPQFLRPEVGPVWWQCVVLGLIIWAVQAGVYGSLAMVASGAGRGLGTRPRLQALMARGAGAVLVAGAAFTAWEGWRG